MCYSPWCCCRKADPFQGPKLGSCLTLRNELSEETHVLTKQESLLGQGPPTLLQQLKHIVHISSKICGHWCHTVAWNHPSLNHLNQRQRLCIRPFLLPSPNPPWLVNIYQHTLASSNPKPIKYFQASRFPLLLGTLWNISQILKFLLLLFILWL